MSGLGFDLFDDEADDEADSLIGIFLHLGLARAHQGRQGRHSWDQDAAWSTGAGATDVKERLS